MDGVVSAACVALLALSGCSEPATPILQPPSVTVLTVQPRTVPAIFEAPGKLEAYRIVEVRSQVTGILTEWLFIEGADVVEGQELFHIADGRYADTLRSAEAQVAQAQARVDQAKHNLDRLTPLLAETAVSEKDVDDATTELRAAEADLQATTATADRARRDYDDTKIRAGMSGRVGRAEIPAGGLVTGPADLLTTIQRIDPIYATFSVSDQERLTWLKDVAEKHITPPAGDAFLVELVLGDGSVFPHRGRLTFADLRFSSTAGKMTVRAELPNAELTLLPGQFVRVRVLGAERVGALLVPQRAVQEGLGGRFVYVVAEGDRAVVRNVEVSVWQGSDWLVEQGLEPGERVIVDGVQHVRPGQPVRPEPWEPTPVGTRP